MISIAKEYDKIIIGAGIYGLYSALFCGKKGLKVLVLEYDAVAFNRATYINQARVHMGYHYPRSYSTAIKSAGYFERFVEDYGYCINNSFTKIYSTSRALSWSNGVQFEKFCRDTNIPCERVSADKYFKSGLCDEAFLTTEYAFDAQILKTQLLSDISKLPNIQILYNARINRITPKGNIYEIVTKNELVAHAPFVLNATYASTNQIIDMLDFEKFRIKYELCELILCTVNESLKNVGITVMDGPFFSIMPFGKTNYHTLTSVTFTPHISGFETLPSLLCMQDKRNTDCTQNQLSSCNDCPAKPESAWIYMSSLAKKYLLEQYQFDYYSSLFSIKPILTSSEIDDSRPTVIRKHSDSPTFISVLSGKINTIYDLDEVLSDG